MMMTSGVPTLRMPSNEKERGERNERSALHNNNTGEFVAITFLTKIFLNYPRLFYIATAPASLQMDNCMLV